MAIFACKLMLFKIVCWLNEYCWPIVGKAYDTVRNSIVQKVLRDETTLGHFVIKKN